jgi:CheY-like chemotaxis protein
MMPEADGYEVLRVLKAHPETADIPFIYLTASVERKEVQAGFDMGARGYIRKPFDSEELFKTIEECTKG